MLHIYIKRPRSGRIKERSDAIAPKGAPTFGEGTLKKMMIMIIYGENDIYDDDTDNDDVGITTTKSQIVTSLTRTQIVASLDENHLIILEIVVKSY